jgi:hypothetical protein
MQHNTDQRVLTTPDQATATRGRARLGEAGARGHGGGFRALRGVVTPRKSPTGRTDALCRRVS